MAKKNSKKTVPELRFRGFTDPWEQRQSSELFVPVKENGHSDLPVLSATQSEGMVYRDDQSRDIKFKKDNLGSYKLVRAGDFVISLRSFQGGFELSDKTGIVSPAYTVFTHAECSSQDNGYWKQYFKRRSFIESLKTVTFGIRDGKAISFSDFSSLKCIFPTLPEQRLIGQFFKTLDSLIAAAERQEALLKQKKQAYLQLMFPREGETEPRLRFAGFSGQWQQRQLGEVTVERTQRSADGELLSVSMSRGVYPASLSDRKDNSSTDKSNYKRLAAGDIVYNSMRMWQGACGLSPYGGIVSPAYTVVAPTEEVDARYLVDLFKTTRMLQKFQRDSQGLTSDTWNLKYPAFSKIGCSFPTLPEQRRIGEFFSTLDSLIAATEKRTASLRALKSAYLQRMFV
ncbi:restriction endonuclease subunit S [Bifidobacterium thermophilum]|uniref:Restriction endonuclease subunit S n=1 Tax=Bifidobacterium thermophilum TaxID=33905 RepID=A0A7X9RNE4_9BIFI|nr:restriction endonuclease subunit S [Bifidobacterium thermophilum]NME61819.1 restriction endonuclease subunit S [Bifidobacterium thermophilum]